MTTSASIIFTKPRVRIVDYGMGNTGSVANALKFLGYDADVTDSPDAVLGADAIILPGVGAFAQAMANLKERKLDTALNDAVIARGRPFLGICLGMQLIAQDSYELGHTRGLGWIKGHVHAIPETPKTRVPHVGWTPVRYLDRGMFARIDADARFYFDHSYRLSCRPDYIAATAHHGDDVVAAIRHKHIFATQFHPEKSQKNGLKLIRNFMNYVEGSRADDAE